MTRISITYEVITEESAQDGDMADHGWIHPQTEARRSLRCGGRRMYDRNVRMARAGRFDWPSLRAAVEFVDTQCCGSFEGHAGDRLSVRAMAEYHALAYEGRVVNYELHLEGLSEGSKARVRRLFECRGVRFYG